MIEHSKIRNSLLKLILENATKFEWSIQGLGMFRCYVDYNTRLHVWAEDWRDEAASDMHTHPWNFRSHILKGSAINYWMGEDNLESPDSGQPLEIYNKRLLHCGENCHFINEAEKVGLFKSFSRKCIAGDTYSMSSSQIHVFEPQEDYTVSLVYRELPKDANPDNAYVYWKEGTEWGSAEPRPATKEEVEKMSKAVLEKYYA